MWAIPWEKGPIYQLGRLQSKRPILSRNIDQKSLETEFLIAICRHTGDKWQSKTQFISTFDPHSSIADNVFDCHLPGVSSLKQALISENFILGRFRPIKTQTWSKLT